MGRCGHPTTLEQRSKIFRYAFFYSEIADLATSSLEYIKENDYIIQGGKIYMNKLMGAHKFMFGNGPAPENLTDALFCYHFFIGNAMKGGVDGTKFTRFKKTIDSAFDSLSTSTTARRIIGIVFGNLADITNIQLLGPRS